MRLMPPVIVQGICDSLSEKETCHRFGKDDIECKRTGTAIFDLADH